MSHESVSQPRPQGELIAYTDGIDEVFRSPGAVLSFSHLKNQLIQDPVAYDMGAVVVQTFSPENGRRAIAFDPHHMIDVAKPWVVAHLDNVPFADTSFDITIGKEWHSPFGVTDEVVGVAAPYTRRNPGSGKAEQKGPGARSQTTAARTHLDQAVERKF